MGFMKVCGTLTEVYGHDEKLLLTTNIINMLKYIILLVTLTHKVTPAELAVYVYSSNTTMSPQYCYLSVYSSLFSADCTCWRCNLPLLKSFEKIYHLNVVLCCNSVNTIQTSPRNMFHI